MVSTMKKFFTVTKFLWIGGFFGVFHQFLSAIGSVEYQGKVILDFSEIMAHLAIYAAIILLVIIRDVPPKHQFRDILLYFIGLDFFYYLYEFFIKAYLFMTDPMNDNGLRDALTSYGIGDFIFWTSIGLAAAVWALVATKLRNRGKKKLYIIMLLPLFAVIVIQLISAIISTTMFFVTGGESIPISGEPGAFVSYPCAIISGVTALVSLIVCLYKFLKKPAVNKNHTQEA